MKKFTTWRLEILVELSLKNYQRTFYCDRELIAHFYKKCCTGKATENGAKVWLCYWKRNSLVSPLQMKKKACTKMEVIGTGMPRSCLQLIYKFETREKNLLLEILWQQVWKWIDIKMTIPSDQALERTINARLSCVVVNQWPINHPASHAREAPTLLSWCFPMYQKKYSNWNSKWS